MARPLYVTTKESDLWVRPTHPAEEFFIKLFIFFVVLAFTVVTISGPGFLAVIMTIGIFHQLWVHVSPLAALAMATVEAGILSLLAYALVFAPIRRRLQARSQDS